MKQESGYSEEEMRQVHERISRIVHRIDCQHDRDTDECFGCLLAECHDVIRALVSELRFNPQRDSEDATDVKRAIDRAKMVLPEFRGVKFGNIRLRTEGGT